MIIYNRFIIYQVGLLLVNHQADHRQGLSNQLRLLVGFRRAENTDR